MISHGVSWALLDSFMPQRRLHSENWKINHLSHTYNKSLKSDRVRSWYCILTANHVKWNCGFRFTLLNEINFLRWYCVIKILIHFSGNMNISNKCITTIVANTMINLIIWHCIWKSKNNQIYEMILRIVNKMIWREEFKGGFFLFWVIDHT